MSEPGAYRLTSGSLWVLPSWAIAPAGPIDARTCRSCGAPIAWLRTRTGKLAPVNPDGTSHFSDCPQAGEWRKR